MPTEVILPKVDMDMATGRISRWFVAEGAAVQKGELLFEIETDKAAMEVDAPASGTLGGVTGQEGVDIPVGQVVAWIYAEGEEPAAAGQASSDQAAGEPPEDGPAAAAAVPHGLPEEDPADEPHADAVSTGADLEAALAAGPAAAWNKPAPGPDFGQGVRATPLARRLARMNGVDLATLSGSGPKGRIQAKDVPAAQAPSPVLPGKAPPAKAKAGIQPAAVSPQPAPATGSNAATWLRQGPGTPLVLIHGFGSDTSSWRPFLAAFDAELPILSIDLPGHGAAVDRPAHGFDDLVAHVESQLAEQGVSVAHLLGHSLGGAIATSVAAGTTIEARSLFLLAPAGLGPEINTGFTRGFAAARDEEALRVWMRELVADPAVLSDSFVKATARSRVDGRLSEAQLRIGDALFGDGTQLFSVRALLDHLAVPIKVVAGTADRIIPCRHMQGLPGKIALHLFPGLGHMPQLEDRSSMAALLRELVR